LIAYADTGFRVSLYRSDALSTKATSLVAAKPVFLLTPLLEVEFANALNLAVFRKHSTLVEIRKIQESFSLHQSSGVFRVAPFGLEIWERAIRLSQRHVAKLGLRTLDLIHVATALMLSPDVFFTFDERQSKLARAEGLHVLPF